AGWAVVAVVIATVVVIAAAGGVTLAGAGRRVIADHRAGHAADGAAQEGAFGADAARRRIRSDDGAERRADQAARRAARGLLPLARVIAIAAVIIALGRGQAGRRNPGGQGERGGERAYDASCDVRSSGHVSPP